MANRSVQSGQGAPSASNATELHGDEMEASDSALALIRTLANNSAISDGTVPLGETDDDHDHHVGN